MILKKIIRRLLRPISNKKALNDYYKRYRKFAFQQGNCQSLKQYEACITRLYHTIEKGLAYDNYRAGFGKQNIESLLNELEQYSRLFSTDEVFYRTALDVLYKYVQKNKLYGVNDITLEKRIESLPGQKNNLGGVILLDYPDIKEVQSMNYEDFSYSRHSIRHFSDENVSRESIDHALKIAQLTPSACNRQGWGAYIVEDKSTIKQVLANQNGNRGFGQEINKLVLLTADLAYFNQDREVFQAYIDGGMYSMSVINAFHYMNVATIPLSASLTNKQEKNVRHILKLDDSEVLILFLGIGHYPETCHAPKSDRRCPNIKYI